MNKVFKVKRNAFGQSIVTSELSRNKGKVATIAITLLSSFFVTPFVLATPVSLQGSATSKNAVSIGSDSFATAVDGVATGKSSVATGQGFSRDEFAMKVAENKAAVDAVNSKKDELNNINTNLEINKKAQEELTTKINELTNVVNGKELKANKLDDLNNQLAKKNNDLADLQQDLESSKNRLPKEYFIGNNKNIAIDFTPILNSLDYNKLNNVNGRLELAQDLKNKLEIDFTDIKGIFTEKQYLDVLNEFINKRSSYDAFRSIYDAEMGNTKYKNISVDNIGNVGIALENIYLRHGESITNFSIDDILTRLENDKRNHAYSTFQHNNYLSSKEHSKEYWMKLGTYEGMQNNLYDQLIISSLIADENSNTSFIANQYTNGGCNSNGGNSSDCYNRELNYIFRLAPLNEVYNSTNRFKFIDMYVPDERAFVNGLNIALNGIEAVVQRIVSDKALSDQDLAYIKHYYDQFNAYSNSIDYNSDKWIVDKNNYRTNLQKVLDFNSKLEEYRQLSEQIRSDAINDNLKDSLLAHQISLKKEIEALNMDSSYFNKMNITFNDSGKNEINQGIDYIIDQENFIDQHLRYYDGKNVIITTVQEKIKEAQKVIDDIQQSIDAKQKEIDKINNQIKDLALTPDEQAASALKAEKEKELENRQVEKEELEADKKQKEKELRDLNQQLSNTSLKDLGLRSQAHGSNAFASGNDSIAIGTDTTVTSTDGIAIGRGSEVTGDQSIALGAENTVTGDKSIAIGVGHTVSGNRSTTIGDPNTITGNDVFVAGNNNNVASNNVMLMGNNITVGTGFDGTVILGANSTVATANPTSSIEIQGNTYNFAGTNPTSTVSVGKAGEERQITNVAAGRISETSTDAINGSQLYAVTEALNAIQSINLDDIAAANINTQATVTAGQGITIAENDNANGTKNYTASAKIGDGLSFDENGAIRANGTTLHAGENVEITGDANSGYTISSKTQIINGGKATVVHAGDNVRVTGDVDNGFTVNVDNMRTTVTGGQGAEVASSDNADGSKNYTVNVKVGEGLTYDDKGNVVNDMKLTAGENVQVSGDAKGGYTISATDTNTQATVSADKGITITETNNANGTKNYAVSAKLGKGLKVDENGAIAATAQPINGGAGVTITTNAQDEAVVNVAGVTTTTDDGKSYTRSDLTKSVGVKGDGKNIRTSTTANGDVQVKLADDVKVNSVTTGNVSISTKGVNAGGKKVTNVAPAEISPTSTDAVNGSQLHATNIQVHNNTQNIAKLGDRVNHLDTKVNKVNKEARAGIAGTVATASLPQVYMAGKSMVSAAAGHYKNENAVAVGYSRASDNGKLVFKLNSSANTRGDFTVGTGIGYQW